MKAVCQHLCPFWAVFLLLYPTDAYSVHGEPLSGFDGIFW